MPIPLRALPATRLECRSLPPNRLLGMSRTTPLLDKPAVAPGDGTHVQESTAKSDSSQTKALPNSEVRSGRNHFQVFRFRGVCPRKNKTLPQNLW